MVTLATIDLAGVNLNGGGGRGIFYFCIYNVIHT